MATVDDRKKLLRRLEAERKSKALLYATGDRQGLQTQIGNDVIPIFVDHLDAIGPVPKISLLLYTSGGNTSAAWNIVNLLHMYCDELEIIAPAKCMSSGTLISRGADNIVMTKQATLGPIDPSVQSPLGPPIPGASPDARVPVSVEAVNGYLDAIKAYSPNENFQGKALLDLSNKVHPLVLGQIFRSRQQIRDLAERLLRRQKMKEGKIKGLVDFLCSESGSHDYTINRREAAHLGLKVEKPSEKLYKILKHLHDSFAETMELMVPFDPSAIAVAGQPTQYQLSRAMVESAKHGAHHFLTEGTLLKAQIQQPQPGGQPIPQVVLQDNRSFDGWKKLA